MAYISRRIVDGNALVRNDDIHNHAASPRLYYMYNATCNAHAREFIGRNGTGHALPVDKFRLSRARARAGAAGPPQCFAMAAFPTHFKSAVGGVIRDPAADRYVRSTVAADDDPYCAALNPMGLAHRAKKEGKRRRENTRVERECFIEKLEEAVLPALIPIKFMYACCIDAVRSRLVFAFFSFFFFLFCNLLPINVFARVFT